MGTAIVKEKQKIVAGLMQYEEQLAHILPRDTPVNYFVFTVEQAIARNPKLLECVPQTILDACLAAAHDGLKLDGKEAALVPRAGRCCYEPMRTGILKKIAASPRVASVHSELVYAADDFRYKFMPHRELVHSPAVGVDRGEMVYVYCVVFFVDGTYDFCVMTTAEVEGIRDRARAKSGPWVTDFGEMAKKTALRRLAKEQVALAEVHSMFANADTFVRDVGRGSAVGEVAVGALEKLAVERPSSGSGPIVFEGGELVDKDNGNKMNLEELMAVIESAGSVGELEQCLLWVEALPSDQRQVIEQAYMGRANEFGA